MDCDGGCLGEGKTADKQKGWSKQIRQFEKAKAAEKATKESEFSGESSS